MGRKNRKQRRAAQQTQKTGYLPYNLYGGDVLPYLHAVPTNYDLEYGSYGALMAYQTIGIVNRCDDLLAQAINSLDWQIVRDSDGDDQIIATSEDRKPQHPAAQAIQNVYRDQGVPLFSLMSHSRNLFGATYIEKRMNEFGFNRSLRWLNPHAVTLEIVAGRIEGYRYAPVNGGEYARLGLYEVAYDHTFNPSDDLRGLSKVDAALSAINLTRSLKSWVKNTIVNNARPGVIVSPEPGQGGGGEAVLFPKDIDALQRQFLDFHKGSTNAHNALISPRPLNVTTLENPELDKYWSIIDSLTKEICVVFGVPLAMAGDSSSTTFKDGEEVRQAFYINTVIPLARTFQDFFNTKVMPFLDPTGDCTFLFDTAQFEDSTASDRAVADLVTIQTNTGLLTLADAQRAQGLVVYPEYEGKVMINGVIMPLDQIAQTPTPEISIAPEIAPQLTAANGMPVIDPTKDGSSVAVMLSLANNVDLRQLQNDLKTKFAGQAIEWNAPDTFHVTLIYAPVVDEIALEQLTAYIKDYPPPDLQLNIGSLASFDSLNEHALHFRIRRNADLEAYQEDIHALCEMLGIQTGQYSSPSNWKPHITMGYAAQRVPAVTFQSRLRVAPSEVQVSVDRDGQDEIVGRVACGHEHEASPTKPVRDYVFEKGLPVAEWREKALKELAAWQRHVKAGKARAFDPMYTWDLVADYRPAENAMESFFDWAFASVRCEPFKATLARVDRVFDSITRKDIGETRQEFEDEFLLAIADAKDGVLSKAQLRSLLHTVIRTLGEQAYRDGLEDGGVSDAELSDEDLAEIARLRKKAEGFANDFVKEFDTYSEAQLDQRPKMWTLKTLNDFYLAGLASADANGIYVWRLGKTEEHCATCLQMNGQRMRLKTWIKNGILPQSDKLDCKGYNCDCGLFNIRGGARG